MAIDEAKMQAFMGRALGDLAGVLIAHQIVLGDRLGIYKALGAANSPLTPAELAAKCGLHERSLREWLNAQAASGYVTFESGRYSLTEEQKTALTDEESPFCVLGGFQLTTSIAKAEPKVREAFRTGKGVGWHEHDPGLFEGTERFFRPGYNADLVSSWIPAISGAKEKLDRGAKLADVGCGLGASTIILAKAFPKSKFWGFDYHPPSIEKARARAKEAGVADRITFEVAPAKGFPANGYDLVAFFDCLHDMGDPVGAARHVKETLAPDGTWMLVEPFASDSVEENIASPVGRLFYAASTFVCTQASLAQEVGLALGAQAGEKRLRDVATEAGFTRFRRAIETPFNYVFEIQP